MVFWQGSSKVWRPWASSRMRVVRGKVSLSYGRGSRPRMLDAFTYLSLLGSAAAQLGSDLENRQVADLLADGRVV